MKRLTLILLVLLAACQTNEAPLEPQARTLVFSEEFSGTSLNLDKWTFCYPWGNEGGYYEDGGNCYNKSTGEIQLYRQQNVRVANGAAAITARKERRCQNGKCFSYTSGMLTTHPHFGGGFTTDRGRIEARIKMPAGKGLWPAFWTLPYPVEHPPEIDVTELLGDTCNTNRMHYHYDGGKYGRNYVGSNLCGSYHTYAVEWQPGLIIWYLDGIERARFSSSRVETTPMYLLLNLAVGGWAGTPGSWTSKTMYIDWVRVWR